MMDCVFPSVSIHNNVFLKFYGYTFDGKENCNLLRSGKVSIYAP